MTRREFARNTIGALFGVSTIPAFGKKPPLPFPCNGQVIWVNLPTHNPDPAGYWKCMIAESQKMIDSAKLVPPPDISEATKIHLKEMWG